MTLLWERLRMLLRNNNMLERYRIPRNFKVESCYKFVEITLQYNKNKKKCSSWLLKIFHGIKQKNADLAISRLLYHLSHHTVIFWFSLQ